MSWWVEVIGSLIERCTERFAVKWKPYSQLRTETWDLSRALISPTLHNLEIRMIHKISEVLFIARAQIIKTNTFVVIL
ncbi:hypothetical protein HQ531_00690 [bacterium]|nr:hypothetical protein [bacterium]